jgi:hypothetical protein
MDAVTRLREELEAEVAKLQANTDVGVLAQRISSLQHRLDHHLVNMLASETGDDSQEARLYARTVQDFASLQSQLAPLRSALSDRPHFLQVLRESGHEIGSTREHLELVGSLDQALQHIVHLMQYDTPDRAVIDVRQGFQLTSGSTNYGRFYFEPPKENSGN